jgi:hypothetical protein
MLGQEFSNIIANFPLALTIAGKIERAPEFIHAIKNRKQQGRTDVSCRENLSAKNTNQKKNQNLAYNREARRQGCCLKLESWRLWISFHH